MKEKVTLEQDDLCVLEMLEDPVFFGEFIRSTEEEIEEGSGWYFDNYQKILKDKNLEVDFMKDTKERLQERNIQLKNALDKLAKGDNFMVRMHAEKAGAWRAEIEENQRIINRIRRGKFQFVHIPTKLWFENLSQRDPQQFKRVLNFLTKKKRNVVLIAFTKEL